jgi:hypothetical protein
MLATTTVARVLTSFAGGWLLLGATLPLMALHGFEPMPDDARAWLVTLAAIAALGTVAQWKLGGAPGTPRKAKARSRPKPESPAATTTEPAAA